MISLEERLADALEELALVRAGKAYHYHVDELAGTRERCSSPYCVDLTPKGKRDHA